VPLGRYAPSETVRQLIITTIILLMPVNYVVFTAVELGKIISLTNICTSYCTQIFLLCSAPNRAIMPIAALKKAISHLFEIIEIRHPQALFQVGLSNPSSTRWRDGALQPNEGV
jgi:hypothetical protein